MQHSTLSLLLLVCAAVPFAILWAIRKTPGDVRRYLLASISILCLTGALLIWAPAAYTALGGQTFLPSPTGNGGFDSQTYSGFLQILFGVPVAVAGSLYAIVLARQSERLSTQFNAYEIRKNVRDRLEKRTAVMGGFAKSLRDINNTAFILLTQVESALAALPDEPGGGNEEALSRIRKEIGWIEDQGIPMLRAALDGYRCATIAVQEGGIKLIKEPRAPLDTIRMHFYPATGESDLGFVGSVLDRDYQAIADRFLVRSHLLVVEDLIGARLERLAQAIVRWSESEEWFESHPNIRDVILSFQDATSANVSGMSDYLGFRFIGMALIRADKCRDNMDAWKPACRIDLGTAILIDSYLSLPNETQTASEIKNWDEWGLLCRLAGESEGRELIKTIPDRAQHFPVGFAQEVDDICAMYSYDKLPADERRVAAINARRQYNALFYHMPPAWLDEEYQDLAARVASDDPPSRRELVDRMACIAVVIQINRISSARVLSMNAIDRIDQSTRGAVQTQFLTLGEAGQREFRRYLLVRWALRTDGSERTAVLGQLQNLVAVSTDFVLAVQLHLDLYDCCMALGHIEQATEHFMTAKGLLDELSSADLAKFRWFGNFKYEHIQAPLEPQLVLLSLWLCGFLTKQAGDLTFGGEALSETEISLPYGFLPLFWAVFAGKGLVVLADGGTAALLDCPVGSYLDCLIKPGQGPWMWDPALLTNEITRRLQDARRVGQPDFLDQLFEEFKRGSTKPVLVEQE